MSDTLRSMSPFSEADEPLPSPLASESSLDIDTQIPNSKAAMTKPPKDTLDLGDFQEFPSLDSDEFSNLSVPQPMKPPSYEDAPANHETSPEHLTKEGNNIRDLLDELEDSIEDIGELKRKYMPKILPDDEEFNSSQVPIDTITKREVQELIESIPKPMVQKPIQPGSSPNDDDNRFLCWNNTGIIRAQFGKEDQSIDVMFHDTEKHSSVNFKNDPNYTFGSMSEDVVVVGSNGKYQTGPSSVHGIDLLESNRDKREWGVELPHVELIEALAAGLGFVAVATDQRNLRLFTNGGMQSFVLTLPGQVLCMSAHDQQLLIVYHDGAGHVDEQNLTMVVYFIDLTRDTIRQKLSNTPVSLSKRSPLAWIGFSDEGTPCTYDYNGILRMYVHDLGKAWVPLLDLRGLTSSALDHYFVVGVSELSQAVRAVKCKRSRYPEFGTETAEVLRFSLPMCETDTNRGQLEEEHIRLKIAEKSYNRLLNIESVRSLAENSNDANEKLLVNTILRLFSLYLNEEKEELARSLVYLIPKDHMSKLPEFAWKTNRRQHFIEALNRTIEEREQSELEARANGREDDLISVSSMASHHNFGRDLHRELDKSRRTNHENHEDLKLKPIPLETLVTNTRSPSNNNKIQCIDDDSGDENDAKKAKRTKSINYNLFSKKRPRVI